MHFDQSRPPGASRHSFFLTIAVALAITLPIACSIVHAKTLLVGANRDYKKPSAVTSAVADGDTVEIDPGEYFDCAVWSVNNLTIEAQRPGAVITDKTCEGKGLFIMRGNNITIRNLTFTRARVADENGAGIRVEGKNLTVENSHFINNENGILAGDSPESRILVSNSEFLRNGKCGSSCAHGIYVGKIALLRVEHSKFLETKDGHHIKSRAVRTELFANEIMDGKEGTASYLVEIPNGGSLVMEDNVLEKGPNNSNHSAAIMIGAEGVTQRTAELKFVDNKLTNDEDHQTIFVKNLTATGAMLSGNSFKGRVVPLSGDGVVR
jgi:hypothetical protein